MKTKIFISILISIFIFSSCELLNDADDNGLSESEIIEGLKTALNVGTDTSVTILNAQDGYFKDEIVKIFLPPEADPVFDYINSYPILAELAGLSGMIDDAVLSINRAAEDAASEAKPIFVDAIENMTVQDGLDILKGKTPAKADFDSTAATVYLKTNTYNSLVTAFAPKINISLDKKLVGDYSTNELWLNLTSAYNLLVTQDEQINSNLGEYATEKALDGLFYKVGLEEKKIRKDPFQWALDIIQKVFGYVFEESK